MDLRGPLEIAFIDVDETLVQFDIDWDRVRLETRYFLKEADIRSPRGLHVMLCKLAESRPDLLLRALENLRNHEYKGIERSKGTPGAESLLHFLSRNNILLYAVSTNDAGAIEKILKKHGLKEYFAGIIGRTNTFQGFRLLKPNPIAVLHTLQGLHIHRSHAIVIGNSVTDAKLARSAHMQGYIYSSTLQSKRNIVVAKTLGDLKATILKKWKFL